MEIYGNTFNYTPGIGNPGNAYFCVCMLRGGSCVMYSNTADLALFVGNSVATTYNNRQPFIIPNSVYAANSAVRD